MKTYSAIVVTKLYKRVQVTVNNDTDIDTVKDLLLDKAPAPLWGSELTPDNVDTEIYDLFEG